METKRPISEFFICSTEKKDGGLKPIFNMKSLNRYVVYIHFKMEGFQVVKSTLKQNDYKFKFFIAINFLKAIMHIDMVK